MWTEVKAAERRVSTRFVPTQTHKWGSIALVADERQPPPDRPHRDKRRRQQPLQPAGPPLPSAQSSYPQQRAVLPTNIPYPDERTQHDNGPPLVPGPGGINVPANARDQSGAYLYLPPHELAALQQPVPPPPPPSSYAAQPPPQYQGSPPGAPVGIPGAAERQVNGSMNPDGAPNEPTREQAPPVDREAGTTGEPLSAGPAIQEDANGGRRVTSSTSADNTNVESEQQERGSSTIQGSQETSSATMANDGR